MGQYSVSTINIYYMTSYANNVCWYCDMISILVLLRVYIWYNLLAVTMMYVYNNIGLAGSQHLVVYS